MIHPDYARWFRHSLSLPRHGQRLDSRAPGELPMSRELGAGMALDQVTLAQFCWVLIPVLILVFQLWLAPRRA